MNSQIEMDTTQKGNVIDASRKYKCRMCFKNKNIKKYEKVVEMRKGRKDHKNMKWDRK